jgi:hypothetical protein
MVRQVDELDELRARVSSWPPLRLARLRRERGSVGVVSPAAPIDVEREEAHATGDRHPPDLREAVIWEDGALRREGRVEMTRTTLEGFGRRLEKTDAVVIGHGQLHVVAVRGAGGDRQPAARRDPRHQPRRRAPPPPAIEGAAWSWTPASTPGFRGTRSVGVAVPGVAAFPAA